MNEQELRSLDAWIAEHVMGWKWMRFDAPAVAANSGKKRDKWCQLVPPFEKWYHQPQLRGIICNCAIDGMPDWTDLSIFKPSTDPASAMQVLEKCIQQCPIGLEICHNGDNWFIERPDMDTGESVMAPTVPLATCLFAKKLFSK